MKKLKIILCLVFVLALVLGSLSCGASSGEDVEASPSPSPTASASPGAAAPKPSAAVKPSPTAKPTPTPAATPTPEAAPASTSEPTPAPIVEQPAQGQSAPAQGTVWECLNCGAEFSSYEALMEHLYTKCGTAQAPAPTQAPQPPAPTPVPATPAPHVHEWETTTVHHDAVTQEKVIPAHQEGSQWTVLVCRCGAEFTSYDAWNEHHKQDLDVHSGYSTSSRNNYYDVPEQTITEVVTPAWDETITKCRTCGATQ